MILTGMDSLVIRMVSGGITVVLLGIVSRRGRVAPIENRVKKPVKTIRIGIFVTIPILCMAGISCCLFGNNLVTLSGLKDKFTGYRQTAEALYSLPLWLQILATGVVVSGVEEMIFREFIYGSLRQRFSFWVTVTVSSVIFGVYHGNLVQGVYACMLALVLAYSRECYQSVLAPWVIHGSANLTSVLVGKWVKLEGEMAELSFLFITFFSGLCLFFAIGGMRKHKMEDI